MDNEKPENSSLLLQIDKNVVNPQDTKSFKIKAGIYAAGLALMSVFIGGSVAASKARKTQDDFFKNVENQSVKTIQTLHAEGVSLAFRALMWGTVWAVGGCSVIFFGIWKYSGANDLKDFRVKMGQKLPKLTRERQGDEPEINTFRELMEYLASQTKSPPKT